MALNMDRDFEPSLDAARFKIPADAPLPLDRSGTFNYEAGEEINFIAKEKKKRVILDIDLNALPRDDYPATQNGVNDRKRRPTAAVSGECGPGFDVTSEKSVGGEREEGERRKRHWKALLEVGDDALREYEENILKREWKFQRGRPSHEDRRPTRESGIGGEFAKRWATKSNAGDTRQVTEAVLSYGNKMAAAAEAVAPPVTRSTRGRAVALPNKYRDSFVGAVVEAQFSQQRRIGKSTAAVTAAHRKTR